MPFYGNTSNSAFSSSSGAPMGLGLLNSPTKAQTPTPAPTPAAAQPAAPATPAPAPYRGPSVGELDQQLQMMGSPDYGVGGGRRYLDARGWPIGQTEWNMQRDYLTKQREAALGAQNSTAQPATPAPDPYAALKNAPGASVAPTPNPRQGFYGGGR